ncbi:P-loop ATPase, Sll1717 family [Mesorhizobium sp. 43Arga]
MEDDIQLVGRNGPFGQLEGASENPGQYIQFHDTAKWGAIALSENDRRVRILIGRKGAGKSRQLARLRVSATVADEYLLLLQRNEVPSNSTLRDFASIYPDRTDRIQRWVLLWKASIISCVIKNIEYGGKHSDTYKQIIKGFPEYIGTNCQELIMATTSTSTVASVMTHIIRKKNSFISMDDYLNDQRWGLIENFSEALIQNVPPIFIFLDTLDQNFSSAPIDWMDFQTGLFNFILSRVYDPESNHRLHIVASIRELVYLFTQESEHGRKSHDSIYIAYLSWRPDAAIHFLIRKLESMDKGCFAENPKSAKGRDLIYRWIGFTEIFMERRGISQDVVSYLIRHTRYLPRDIVQIGNAISLVNAKNGKLTPGKLVEIISSCARSIALEVVESIAIHLSVSEFIRGRIDYHAYKRSESAKSVIVRHYEDQIERLIYFIGEERVSMKRYRGMISSSPSENDFDNALVEEIFDHLWKHGMLAVHRRGSEANVVQYIHTNNNNSPYVISRLPMDAEFFVFHPTLIDAYGIRPTQGVVYGT